MKLLKNQLQWPFLNIALLIVDVEISLMDKLYIDARLVGNTLIVFAGDELKNYDKEQQARQIALLITFGCTTGTKTLRFDQNFLNENNHNPIFDKESYNFNLPLPLPKEFDIALFNSVRIIVIHSFYCNI